MTSDDRKHFIRPDRPVGEMSDEELREMGEQLFDAITPPTPTTHTVQVMSEWAEHGEERTYWECDCGRAGSCASYRWETHSDEHIDYNAGHRRVDRTAG